MMPSMAESPFDLAICMIEFIKYLDGVVSMCWICEICKHSVTYSSNNFVQFTYSLVDSVFQDIQDILMRYIWMTRYDIANDDHTVVGPWAKIQALTGNGKLSNCC